MRSLNGVSVRGHFLYLIASVILSLPGATYGSESSCNSLLAMSEDYVLYDQKNIVYFDFNEIESTRFNWVNGRLQRLNGEVYSSPYVVNLVVSAQNEIFAFSVRDFYRRVRHSSPVGGLP